MDPQRRIVMSWTSSVGVHRTIVLPSAAMAETVTHRHAVYLVGNRTVLMFVGLLSGLVVSAAPFPRLMLTAHIQFLLTWDGCRNRRSPAPDRIDNRRRA
jgi:hypothetical protein